MATSGGTIMLPSAQYKAAVEAYWAAETPEQERRALAVMQAYERQIRDSGEPYFFWLGSEAGESGYDIEGHPV